MALSDHKITERIVQLITRERNRQKSYKFDDATRTNGELISAAVSYADLARKQVLTRDNSEVEEVRRAPYNSGYVPPGGMDNGYNVTGPMMDKPATWPFKEMWYPGRPRTNLIRAAALIIAELERLEKADRAAIAKPQRGPAKIDRVTLNPTWTIDMDDPYLVSTTTLGSTLPTTATLKVVNGTAQAGAFVL